MDEISRLPIIKLWDQIFVPLQGEITDALAERLSTDVLQTIYDTGADGLVIDVTGVWMMDSHLCSVLSQLAASARLLGTRTILTGMTPDTALTLQTMGVELEGVRTALTVEEAFEFLGIQRVRTAAQVARGATEKDRGKAQANDGAAPAPARHDEPGPGRHRGRGRVPEVRR